MSDSKLGKSEILLIKKYCARIPDEDLCVLASSLPQSIVGDRSAASDVFQKDKEMDRWLVHASGADDWFFKVDSIGEFARLESDIRAKKAVG
jgi:predicted RNA-binding Zn ribbon-like protein